MNDYLKIVDQLMECSKLNEAFDNLAMANLTRNAANAIKDLYNRPKVVRCYECRFLTPKGTCYEFADDNIRPCANDFCSYGERKDD